MNPVASTFYNDPNLGVLTKYRYKVSAVSTTGNEGDPSLPLTAWTSFAKSIFPLSYGAIRGGLTVADINNDGFKEIFGATKSGYIIGLDHEFNELFDIDDNITTQGAYAIMQPEVWGTPAVGDLHGNGQNQLVDCSRNGSPNRIYCFSGNNTFANHDSLWSKKLPEGNIKGVILSNIDNSIDGSLESIVACESGSNSIVIYDADGNLRTTINSNGTYDAIAVADIDGTANGHKEIIKLSGSSIYIWNYDGSPYNGTNDPKYYTLPSGFTFQGSPIVCDIDNSNDGKKEILASVTTGTTSQIYAIRCDVSALVTGWNTPIITTNGSMSVGDLNHDGKLEIVTLGPNTLTVLKNNGELMPTPANASNPTIINDLSPAGNPILADLDDDSDVEIVFGSTSATNRNLYVYNYDLTKVLGYPVAVNDVPWGTPCVSDIDNDGKNELMLGVDNSIYLWRTNGKANNIEWGSDRQNHYNTGEYTRNCNSVSLESSETWSSDHDFCGDLIVKSGTLTVNNGSNLKMGNSTTITVLSGASLVIDSGHILNANVRAMAGSNVTIRNNGSITLRSNAEFYTETGTTVDIPFGSIDK
jgi:hypothetical protein